MLVTCLSFSFLEYLCPSTMLHASGVATAGDIERLNGCASSAGKLGGGNIGSFFETHNDSSHKESSIAAM